MWQLEGRDGFVPDVNRGVKKEWADGQCFPASRPLAGHFELDKKLKWALV